MYFNDDSKYDGDWCHNDKHGKGVFYFNSGDEYHGDFFYDTRTGKGVYYDKKYKYEGEFSSTC